MKNGNINYYVLPVISDKNLIAPSDTAIFEYTNNAEAIIHESSNGGYIPTVVRTVSRFSYFAQLMTFLVEHGILGLTLPGYTAEDAENYFRVTHSSAMGIMNTQFILIKVELNVKVFDLDTASPTYQGDSHESVGLPYLWHGHWNSVPM